MSPERREPVPAPAIGDSCGVLYYSPCRIGLRGELEGDDNETSLLPRVMRAELTRRLPCADIQALDPGSDARAAGLDCLVELGAGGAIGGLDPTLLLPRLFPPSVLARRLEYLRLMGWYPRNRRAVMVEGHGGLVGRVPEMAAALAAMLAEDEHLAVVTVQLGAARGDGGFADALTDALTDAPPLTDDTRVYRLPPVASEEDLAAAIQGCSGFVGCSRQGSITAFCYGRPFVMLSPGPERDGSEGFARMTGRTDLLVEGPSQVAAALAQAAEWPSSAPDLAEMQATIDSRLDGIAEAAETSYRRRISAADYGDGVEPSRVRELEAQLVALRRAYEAKSRQLVVERVALADQVDVLRDRLGRALADANLHWRRSTTEAERRSVVEEELRALRQTRTHRWTAAPRHAYAHLRRLEG